MFMTDRRPPPRLGLSDADERTNDRPIVICTHTPGRNQMTGAVAPATTVSWQHYAIYTTSVSNIPRRLCFMSNDGACGGRNRLEIKLVEIKLGNIDIKEIAQKTEVKVCALIFVLNFLRRRKKRDYSRVIRSPSS